MADRVLLVERDPRVAAVWRPILNGNAEWLADQILCFKPKPEAVFEVLDKEPESIRELAFQTILRNRVQRGGIMAPGAGFMREGENGRGLSSRRYPETLARRIRAIAHFREMISFQEGGGMRAIEDLERQDKVAFFIDPP
jgi:DNA adenine methylase